MKRLLLVPILLSFSVPAMAKLSCDDLKSTIAAQLDAKHVVGYTLDVVAKDAAADGKIVGSCNGGSDVIVYTKAKKS